MVAVVVARIIQCPLFDCIPLGADVFDGAFFCKEGKVPYSLTALLGESSFNYKVVGREAKT